ncbi:MAG: DUF1801 domain-containing protein [Saprospiraceae bacterium]|nr:DUF1801 domain-containing protein [Saprospiraceae bacterium]
MQDKRVDAYIAKQKSPQKEVCIALRKIILDTYPEITEEMKWGVPSYGNGTYYFVALKTHVNLGFSIKGLSKEQIALFQGTGKTMRIIEINSVNEIEPQKIVTLLHLIKKTL